jgi:oligoribonuclease
MKHMPELFEGFISPVRLLDISTLKVLYMLYKDPNVPVKKAEKHRAIDDIKESIEELRFYMTSGFTKELLTK